MDRLQAIRGIAFGFDDTLVNSAPGLTPAVGNALYALGSPVTGEEHVVTWIGNGAGVLMEWALTQARQKRATLRAAIDKLSVDDYNIPQDEQLCILRKLFDRYCAETMKEGSFLFPAVANTLGALYTKGLPPALVTNKPTPFTALLLDALGIAEYFTVVIGGDGVQNKKPRPKPLLSVVEKLFLTPAELLFIGDSHNDIQAAKAAGCCSVDLTYDYNYSEPLALNEPDYLFDQLSELLPALGLPHSETQELKHG